MADIKLTHVAYKGACAPALLDLMAGNVNMMIVQPTCPHDQVTSGKLRALAVSSAKRSASYPDIPTVAPKAGVARKLPIRSPGTDSSDQRGWRPISLKKISDEVVRAANTESVRAVIAAQGGDVVASTPTEFTDFIAAERKRYEVDRARGRRGRRVMPWVGEQNDRGEFSLAGKTALITGAARGIGTGIAEVFAEAGATVIVNSLTRKHLDGFTAALQQRSGQRIVPVAGDATNPAAVADIVARSFAVTGQIDNLVNNLGDSIRRPLVPLKDGESGVSDQEIQTILSLNLLATIYCSRAVGKHMIERRSGKVINISSFGALQGAAGNSLYAAAKAGLTGLFYPLACPGMGRRSGERHCRRPRNLPRRRYLGPAGFRPGGGIRQDEDPAGTRMKEVRGRPSPRSSSPRAPPTIWWAKPCRSTAG